MVSPKNAVEKTTDDDLRGKARAAIDRHGLSAAAKVLDLHTSVLARFALGQHQRAGSKLLVRTAFQHRGGAL